MSIEELNEEREHLHEDLFKEMGLVRDELNLILYISAVTFLFPVSLFCKYVFAKLTSRKFILTITD